MAAFPGGAPYDIGIGADCKDASTQPVFRAWRTLAEQRAGSANMPPNTRFSRRMRRALMHVPAVRRRASHSPHMTITSTTTSVPPPSSGSACPAGAPVEELREQRDGNTIAFRVEFDVDDHRLPEQPRRTGRCRTSRSRRSASGGTASASRARGDGRRRPHLIAVNAVAEYAISAPRPARPAAMLTISPPATEDADEGAPAAVTGSARCSWCSRRPRPVKC